MVRKISAKLVPAKDPAAEADRAWFEAQADRRFRLRDPAPLEFKDPLGDPGDGFSWREQPDYYVAAYLIHPLVERCQLVERCLEPMLIAHPEIVNCKHPKTGETFLQYAVKTTTFEQIVWV